MISDLLISSEKIADVMPCLIEQAREKSSASVTFADRRAGGEDDHLAGVQAVGDLVELGEAGGDADALAAAGGDRVDLVHRALQQLLEPDVVLAGAPLGDVVDLGLGAVDHLVDVAALAGGRAVAELDDPGAGLDQPAQGGPLGHDLRVEPGVGGGRHRGDQRVQVGRAADPHQLPGAGQLGRDRHRVGRLAPPVEVEDRVVDDLVGRPVEVAGPQHLDHVGDRVLGQQHAAEHGLLGLHVLRRLPVEVGRAWAGRPDVVRDRHRAAPPAVRTCVRSIAPECPD